MKTSLQSLELSEPEDLALQDIFTDWEISQLNSFYRCNLYGACCNTVAPELLSYKDTRRNGESRCHLTCSNLHEWIDIGT